MAEKITEKVIFSLLTVLLLAFIFGNSLADGEQSSGLSIVVTEWINNLLGSAGLQFTLPHIFVRKLAHFTEFSLLGAFLTMTVWSWRAREWRFWCVWIPLAAGAFAAGIDELLQTLVPGRYGCLSDAMLDFSGILWASLAVSALLRYIIKKHTT